MRILITMLAVLFAFSASNAQDRPLPLLPDKDTMLLTVFLKHDQSMNNDERAELIKPPALTTCSHLRTQRSSITT